MGIPIPKWGFTYPHFEIGLVQSLIQFGSLGGESSIWNISKSRSQFQNSDPHTVMGRETQKLEIGESPFQKRVCAKLGTNIYAPSGPAMLLNLDVIVLQKL